MNRDQVIAELVDARVDRAKSVTNPQGLRITIRRDLEQLTDERLQDEYDRLTGAHRAKTATSDAKDYDVTTLDRAISDALVYLSRHFDPEQIEQLLLDDYQPAIAGRALVMAANGDYRIHLGNFTPVKHPDLATSKPMSLADYRNHLATPSQERTA